MALIPKKMDSRFQWLPTKVVLAFVDKNNPLGEIKKHYDSLDPAKQKELIANAKAANNEISKSFLASIVKPR
jgi:hypothetical protein